MMEFPKGFGKWSSEQQRIWIKNELEKAEIKANNLRKLSRKAQKGIIQVEDDRPDLIDLKNEDPK